jgi:hypothetical protein
MLSYLVATLENGCVVQIDIASMGRCFSLLTGKISKVPVDVHFSHLIGKDVNAVRSFLSPDWMEIEPKSIPVILNKDLGCKECDNQILRFRRKH